jgi:hypothetical protein
MLFFHLSASVAEIAVSPRDWMHIKTELNELQSHNGERQCASANNQETATVQPTDTEASILKQIADALRRDEEEWA